MLGQILAKVIGTQNDRELKRLRPLVEQVNSFEPTIKALRRARLRAKTVEFRERLAQGEALDDLLPEAFAVVREAGRRVLNMRHFDVQLIGGMVLHNGNIAEMKTGEGKTLVATLPAYLNALGGKGVHVVTVNDYLARRDSEWMGRVYRFLGLTVGVIQHDLNDAAAAGGLRVRHHLRHEQRVRLRLPARQHEVRPGDGWSSAAITSPSSTKSTASSSTRRARRSSSRARPRSPPTSTTKSTASSRKLKKGEVHQGQVKAEDRERLEATGDYIVDEKHKTVTLDRSRHGARREAAGAPPAAGRALRPGQHARCCTTSSRACAPTRTIQLDVDYMIKDGQVVIVDEFTGRLMPGRRWSDGLHQAVEAKEKVKIERENQTLATITFQNYFRKYKKLSGMTGTAETEAAEFAKIYNLDVIVIPTNRPMRRVEEPDLGLPHRGGEVRARSSRTSSRSQNEGRPVLVGTVSIEKSERLSAHAQASAASSTSC